MTNPKVVILDNQDSFVYNLAAEFTALDLDVQVFRNTVAVETVLAARGDLICLSPGPGHPRAAGNLMQLIDAALGKVPLLGICLGFQALLEYFGGSVHEVGAVHGQAHALTLTEAGETDPCFANAHNALEVARYHSLGCTDVPVEMTSLARIGNICMAARVNGAPALGFQFHPESILTTSGPQILQASVSSLLTQGK